jgi:hypothetical protein
MKPDPELLQIALGLMGACMNAGFLQTYILQRNIGEGKGVLTIEEITKKATEVYEHLDYLVREARRET